MTDDFQSISKGVFIIPFHGDEDNGDARDPEAGPSRPRRHPLKPWYDQAYESFSAAHENYEAQKTEEQLEDVADWLEGCKSTESGELQFGFETRRLPVGIMQDTYPRLTGLLGKVVHHRAVLQGREMIDLAAGVRGVALGLLDDPAGLGKNGRSGIDDVGRWYSALVPTRQTPMLIHIQDAQLVPPLVLSEIIYVLSLRASLPIRVLLSVPSVSMFMASFQHIEASAVEVDVLGMGARRASAGGVQAVLEAGRAPSPNDPSSLHLGHDLSLELEEEEKMFGGGVAATLKSLKWRLLHHGANSPLASLVAEDDVMAGKVEAILRGEGDEHGLFGDLLEIGSTRVAQAVLNPTPRVSVFHALSTSAAYTSRLQVRRPNGIPEATETPAPTAVAPEHEPAISPRSAKRRRTKRTILSPVEDTSPIAVPQPRQGVSTPACQSDQRGDLKELEVLFNIWRSAGRNVNLWDWLEGFRGSLMSESDRPTAVVESNGGPSEDRGNAEVSGSEIVVGGMGDNEGPGDPEPAESQSGTAPSDLEVEAALEEKAARLHAVFVRFCEEARMMGLVRARGRAKRADEVVKSVGLV